MQNIKTQNLSNIVFIYLTIGAINWLPFISPSIVNSAKYLLFVYLLYLSNRCPKHEVLGPFSQINFIVLLFCCIPALLLGQGELYINLLDFIFIFLSAYIVGSLPLQFHHWYRIFYKVVISYGFIGLICIIAQFGIFNIQAPAPWEYSDIATGGFGGYRTGWANSLFLFVPFGLFYYVKEKRLLPKYLAITSVLLIIYMQLSSGGRTGMIGSFLAILIVLRANKFVFVLIIIFAYFFYDSMGEKYFKMALRMDESQIRNKAGSSELDKITSGRTSGYEAAIAAIKEEPILGYGFNRNEDVLERWDVNIEVHNTYLKRFMEGGIMLILWVLCMFFFIFKDINRKFRNKENKSFILLFQAMFFIGLLLANFEPNYLIGSFQGEVFFWFVIFVLLKFDNYNLDERVNNSMVTSK